MATTLRSDVINKEIETFFLREDVSRVTPDTKKSAKNPSNPLDIQPIRYQLGSLKVLFSTFCSESTSNISYATLCRHVPSYITSPSATDWGTCFCSTCLNPQLKIEKLCRVDKTLLFAPLDENVEQDEDFSQLLETLKKYQFKDTTSIQFYEWTKVPNPLSRKGVKISRKMLQLVSTKQFINKLIAKLKILKHCLYRANCQFKAFKSAREAACDATNKTVTVHLDLSENAKLTQAKEEKSAYYHKDSISLHPMYIWTNKEKFSATSISGNKSHKAAAVSASLEPVLCKISFQQGRLW